MDRKSYRLDQILVLEHPDISRAQLQKFIKSGAVLINGEVCTKASEKISELDNVSLVLPENKTTTTSVVSIKVLYEDDECVVIDKPVGTLSHSKGAYNSETTVADWLKHLPGFTFPVDSNRSGIVHRLDRATSGVMICAKTPAALRHLQKQFQDRKAKKTYRARVAGHLKNEHAILDLPIERNPKRPQTFRVGANGKSAITEYTLLQHFDTSDHIELKPTTGRTHQLRVHMEYLGHPIVGDVLYRGPSADRLYLHAYSLEITLPNKTRSTFTSSEPSSFSEEF